MTTIGQLRAECDLLRQVADSDVAVISGLTRRLMLAHQQDRVDEAGRIAASIAAWSRNYATMLMMRRTIERTLRAPRRPSGSDTAS